MENYEGKLIVVEGIDGAGKSTQIGLVKKWLECVQNNKVVLTSWNSSERISKVIKKMKRERELTPIVYSMLHAADFMNRLEKIIYPELKKGSIVLCDRYIYTGLARDAARDVPANLIVEMYKRAIEPDLVFYFDIDVEISLERILMEREPKYYEAGMDLQLTDDLHESYKLFQGMVMKTYKDLSKVYNFIEIDGRETVERQQKILRETIRNIINV
jgi:dTMP kinase